MAICLKKEDAQKLKATLKSGDTSVDDLAGFSSQERRDFFSKFADDELTTKLNTEFERRMTSKTEEALENFIDTVNAPKDQRDLMLQKVKSADNVFTEDGVFLEDLAAQKVGIALTDDEFSRLTSIARNIDEATEQSKKFDEGTEAWTKARERAGLNERILNKEAGEMKRVRTEATLDKLRQTHKAYGALDIETREEVVQFLGHVLRRGAGSLKSIKASFDNSLWGRQAIKLLMNVQAGTKDPFVTQKIWANGVKESWGNFKNTFFSDAYANRVIKELDLDDETAKYIREHADDLAEDMTYADVYSRENYTNGKYTRAVNNYGIGVQEEAFPDSLPGKIPYIGKAFKASENVYNAGAQKIRADLADAFIQRMEDQGVDMMVKENADRLGKLVGTLTGRGYFGKNEPVLDTANRFFFSPRFFKSNLDTLLDLRELRFVGAGDNISDLQKVKKLAGYQSLQNLGAMGAALSVAHIFGVTDLDPRSDRFGKLEVNDGVRVDVTGGLEGIVGLLSTIVSGKRFDSKTGTYRDITAYGGEKTDLLFDFISNKQSPAARLVYDMVNGEFFGGQPITLKTAAEQIFLPITVSNIKDQHVRGNDLSAAFAMILGETFGFSTSKIRWAPQGSDWKELREADEAKYWEASRELSEVMQERVKPLREDDYFQELPWEEQSQKMQTLYREEKDNIISSYSIQ